ncbi:MAG TPA: hypothetical protein VMV10_18415 [Pirellulales bacterium]|nr:hypothetical protein [Pirellulales bacterium]
MSEFHGNLLIGGMTLKNLSGTLDEDTLAENARWHGEFSIDPQQSRLLESGRPYRLELEDGRAGKIVILRVDRVAGRQTMQAVFDGLTAIEDGRRWETREPAAREEAAPAFD